MKFRLTRSSTWGEEEAEIEINTLEELIALIEKEKNDVIIERPMWEDDRGLYAVKIYDDYIE